VVLRRAPGGGTEVLLVHRPGHGDWTLPKGKADPGETDEACALREVAEETGLACRLGPELATSRYRDRQGRAKAVRYWAMTAGGGAFTANAEVDQVRWRPVPEALPMLSYPGDRSVLQGLAGALRSLVFVARHASAGDPGRWTGDPRHRPIDARGRCQAAALAAALDGYPVTRLLASPVDRCVQTLEPLSARLARPVEHAPALAETTPEAGARTLLAGLGPGPLVLCTHRDVVEELAGSTPPVEEGAVWLLAREPGGIRPLRHWAPLDLPG
jgi:8-oxo-dGTP diphosphatase